MKRISVLGSTGKIGQAVLEIVRAHPNDFKIVGLSANNNVDLLKKQCEEFKPQIYGIGAKELVRVATIKDADLVVVAVVGLAGLIPTLEAIKSGKDIAIATKEVLVVAGELVMREAKKNRINIVPIDSEHSAIFQCLKSGKTSEIKKIFLTMGQGKIAKMKKEDLEKITLEEIMDRKVWSMGNKISIDSATCINKSFEIIEAGHLFNLKSDQIEVLVHPEYICHSMIEFQDNSIIAEMGTPDMKRYIQYALYYPERKMARITKEICLIGKKLTFKKAPYGKFLGLKLGFIALKTGGTLPAVLHGADESAVAAFLARKISFLDISQIIEQTMADHEVKYTDDLNEIISAENWGRAQAEKIINNKLK